MADLSIDRAQLEIIIKNDDSRKRLRELEEDTSNLTKEMKNLEKQGKKDTQAYREKEIAIRRNSAEMDRLSKAIGLTGMTMKELVQKQRQLNTILANMDPRLHEYKKLQAELATVTGRVNELKRGASNAGLSLKGMANGFNKYMGIFTAFAASIAGFVMGFKSMIDKANQFGESVANLSALTGLAGKELKWLSDKAKEVAKSGTDAGIKITAGAQEIVDAYTLMGSAKPELLKNKEALDQVTQSALIMADAAKIKATDAVDSLANTMNQFGAPASDAARYMNVLAAGSKEGAAAIPSVSASMVKFGAAAASANITVEESVGLIEALAEKGIKGEIAGTQIKTALLKMQTGADDTNPKIVGLQQALDNLNAKNMTAAEMVKFFGQESYIAAQVIVGGTERVKYFTEAVTDTNVALEQAAINTNTEAAAKKRAINNYELAAIALGEKLAPAITASTTAFTYMLNTLNSVISFFRSSAVAAEEASKAFDNQVTKVADLNAEIVPLLSRYDELIIKSGKSTTEQNELNEIIKTVADTIPSAITKFDEYGNAISISTNRVREFIAAETDRLKVVNDEAIRANKNKLELVEQQEKASQSRLNELAKKGYFTIAEITSTGSSSFSTYRRSSEIEIKAEQEKYKSLLSQKRGYQAEIERLNGDALTKEVERREAEREAERKAEQKLQEQRVAYNKMTKKELEKLSAEGDELATQILLTKNDKNVDSNKKLASSYEKLSQEISKYKNQLSGLVATGSFEDAKIVGVQITQLENQKNIIDKIIANGGNVKKFLDDLTNDEQALIEEEAELWDQFYKDPKNMAGINDYQNRQQEKKERQTEVDSSRVDKNIYDGEQKSGFDGAFYLDQVSVVSSAAFDIWKNAADARVDYELSALDKAMEKELSNKNLTEEQKDKIREKYAKKERAIKTEQFKKQKAADIIRATIDGIIAVIKAGGLITPLGVATAISTAAQIAVIAAQPVPQFSKGKYLVRGADDGKMYSAPWIGTPRTGLYTRPSLFAENGGEIIIDAPTTSRMRANAPQLINAIYHMAGKMPQRSEGKYDIPGLSGNSVNSEAGGIIRVIDKLDNRMEELDKILSSIKKEGIRSKLVYSDLQNFSKKVDDIEQQSSF
ncbi:MAG: phage tail tape measure protein [Lentimicrobium sp.]|jgi:TP901 family phage tail tape measure protein|nr:phage tail tape measure protein [Lentimicrobium sp.]